LVVPLDERVDLGARFPWRTRQASGEKHVELGFEAADFRLEVNHLLLEFRLRLLDRHG